MLRAKFEVWSVREVAKILGQSPMSRVFRILADQFRSGRIYLGPIFEGVIQDCPVVTKDVHRK